MFSNLNTRRTALIPVLLCTVLACAPCKHAQAQQDLVLRGVYEAALDLPRILFLLRHRPAGPPLTSTGQFEPHYGFLDTGASGILLSRETAQGLGVAIEPRARFGDVGVGGMEYFNVSKSLYMGIAGYNELQRASPNLYRNVGRARFQIKQAAAGLLGQGLDVIGMPVMLGRIVVLDAGATNRLGHFAATIKQPGESDIPKVHFKVALRLAQFSHPNNRQNIPPLPVMAPNPVIDGILMQYRGRASHGNWLLDTGATISLISRKQATQLGLMNAQGQPTKSPDFSLPLGGVGNMIQVPGFQIDRLIIPTKSGRRIVFLNARLGVHDISFFDESRQTMRTLHGVFGSNFLCASAKMQGLLPGDVANTVFDKIVIDLKAKILGFRLSQ